MYVGIAYWLNRVMNISLLNKVTGCMRTKYIHLENQPPQKYEHYQ